MSTIGTWGSRESTSFDWTNGVTYDPFTDAAGKYGDNWNLLTTSTDFYKPNVAVADKESPYVTLYFDTPSSILKLQETGEICSYWEQKPNFMDPNASFTGDVGPVGIVGVNPIIIDIPNGKYTNISIYTRISYALAELRYNMSSGGDDFFNNTTYINRLVNLYNGITSDDLDKGGEYLNKVKKASSFDITAILRSPSTNAMKKILKNTTSDKDDIAYNIKMYSNKYSGENMDIYNFIYDSNSNPLLDAEGDFLEKDDVELYKIINAHNNITGTAGTQKTIKLTKKNYSTTDINWALRYIQIKITEHYGVQYENWRFSDYDIDLNIIAPVLFIQRPYYIKPVSIYVGWGKDSDGTNVTTGTVDYTGLQFTGENAGNPPKLVIKNNTDEYVHIYGVNNTTYAPTVRKENEAVTDPGVPSGTYYNSDNISISGTVASTDLKPNEIKELPDGVIDVSIDELKSNVTNTQYYGITLYASNFADGVGITDVSTFNSLYLSQFGYPANGTVYPSTDFTDFAAIPSYETAGKISRNLDIEIRDNSYTNTSKWTLSVYKSYDGNTFSPSVDTDVKLIAAGNTGNGQLIVTGGNKKVTVTVEFPENVRKGYKDGNIAVWYNFYLKIEGASVDWASDVLLTVKQKEPSISFAAPQTQIAAGSTSANFSMSSSNPWYLQCMDTKNDMAEDWIGQKYEGSNGANLNVTIGTPYSYENREDYNAQTWTYTVRVYARPVNASKNDISWITSNVYYKEYTITQPPGIFKVIYDDNGNDAAGILNFSPYGSEIKYQGNSLITPPGIHIWSSAPWTYTVQTANPDKPYLQTKNGVTIKSNNKNDANEEETTYNLIIPASRNYNNNTAYTLTFGYTKEDGALIDKTDDKNKKITISQREAIFDISTDPSASGFSSDGGRILFRVRSSNYWNYGYPSDTNPKLTKIQENLAAGSTTINGKTSILPALTDSLITFSVPKNENVDVDRTFKTAFWSRILPSNKTYATVSSSDASANTDLFVVKTINITQGKAAETSGFELYTQDKQNLLQSNTFSNIPRAGGKYVFCIKNVGNIPATFKISVTSNESWIKFDSSTTITVAKNDFGYVWFTIDENVLTTEDRSVTISVMQTSPVQDERLVTVTQLGGAKGFTLDWYDEQGNSLEGGVINKGGMTLTGKITNTGTVQSKYIVSCETSYSQSMSSDTALTGFVNPGSTKNIKITISPNKTTETRTGLTVTVQDYNDYSMSKTTSWSQNAWPEPSFSLTVYKGKYGNTYGDIMPQGSAITAETPYFILADLPNGHDDKLKWSASADSAYAGDLILNGTSSITWPQKLADGTEFHYNTIQNKTLYDQFVTVTVECYYDDADVKSDKYNKSSPFTRTFSYTIKSTLDPTIIISDYGDSYLTPSGTTPIYLFGPAAGTRTFSVTETQGAECIWSVNKPNNVSYAAASPATSSAYTTIRVGCTNKMSSNVGVSGSGSISATALCSGHSTAGSINFGIFRFPKPIIQVTGGTSHIFNCNDSPYTFEITTANSFKIGGVDHIYNAEYSFESSNNSFNVERVSNGVKVTPPVNTSTTETLVCNITIYYNWGSDVPDHDQDDSIMIRCVVEPAPAISFTVNPTEYSWKCNTPVNNPLTVKVKADAGGNAAMSKLINWTYTRNEYGTDGAEFVIRRGKTDGEDGLTIRPPVNPSTVNYKECHVTFEYGYEGSGETKTLTAVYSVEPAPPMKITLVDSYKLLKPGAGEAFNIELRATDENGAKLPLPVSWDYEKVESNNADDFIVRQFTEQNFQLSVTPPKNTSTDRQKKCDITFTCWYSDGDGKKTWSAVGTYIVDMARVPGWDVTVKASEEPDSSPDIISSSQKEWIIGAKGGRFSLTADLKPDEYSAGLGTEWDWSKEEKGTDGDEFIVKRTGDTITMDCPSNPSVLKEKKCVLTFTYGYVGSDTRWTDTYTFTVQPNADITFEVNPNKKSIPAGGKVIETDESGGEVESDYLVLTVKADGGATNIPVEWDFVKDERGTNGDEFTVRRTGTDNVLWLIPPTNPSVTKTKECTLTFTYGYAGGDMEQTYVCSYEVRPADPVTLSVNPDGAETKADGKYVKDGVSYNPIQIEAKAAGSKNLRTVCTWSKIERGTDGNEFDIRDAGTDRITVRMPVNVSTSKQKTCAVTFEYGYEDSDVRWTKTSVFTVNPAGDATIEIKPPEPLKADADGIVRDPEELDRSFGIAVKVTGDPEELTALTTWSWTKIERGTDGDEFDVRDNGKNGLTMRMPENTTAEKQKECVITFTYGYEGGDRTWKATNTYTVNAAGYLTLNVEKDTKTFDALETDGSIGPHIITDVSVGRIGDGKKDELKTNWTFEKEESGTTGDEFRVSRKIKEGTTTGEYQLCVTVPTNESRTTVKKCLVYVKGYLGSDDMTNTVTRVCDYRVSTLGLPLMSFEEIKEIKIDDKPTVDESTVVTEKTTDLIVDGGTIPITLYTRKTAKQFAAYRWEADKQEIEFNGKVVARIDNTSGVFDQQNGTSAVNLTVIDSELTEEQIIGMFTFTGYDVNDNMSRKIRLQIRQGGMADYRPEVQTGDAVTRQNAAYLYYNIGIPAYVPAAQQGSFGFGDIIIDEDGRKAAYNEIDKSKGQCDVTDWGIMIRRKGNDKWIEIWQSKYKDKDFKPILTKAKDATHDIYTACLAYTNNMIKFKIDSEYEYKAVIKADYRRGASDAGKWVKGEIISGEVKSFIYQAFRIEKDPETIRPYFLPRESVAGYLGGCEVKNFFNSKAVTFNRKKNPVITVSNFASHWTEDGGVRINITDALVDSILHTPAFNAAWAYINDPDNITHAKTEYIKNVILPNIIVNADSTVEIWADMSTDGLSVSDNAGDGWSRMTNVGTKFETEPDGSKTLTFDITERRPYCFIMKLKY